MIVYLARDIPPFVMYCINEKPHSSLLIESTDSMMQWNPSKADTLGPPHFVHYSEVSFMSDFKLERVHYVASNAI